MSSVTPVVLELPATGLRAADGMFVTILPFETSSMKNSTLVPSPVTTALSSWKTPFAAAVAMLSIDSLLLFRQPALRSPPPVAFQKIPSAGVTPPPAATWQPAIRVAAPVPNCAYRTRIVGFFAGDTQPAPLLLPPIR